MFVWVARIEMQTKDPGFLTLTQESAFRNSYNVATQMPGFRTETTREAVKNRVDDMVKDAIDTCIHMQGDPTPSFRFGHSSSTRGMNRLFRNLDDEDYEAQYDATVC